MNITIVGAGALGNMLATKFSENNKVKLVVKFFSYYKKERACTLSKMFNGLLVKCVFSSFVPSFSIFS